MKNTFFTAEFKFSIYILVELYIFRKNLPPKTVPLIDNEIHVDPSSRLSWEQASLRSVKLESFPRTTMHAAASLLQLGNQAGVQAPGPSALWSKAGEKVKNQHLSQACVRL